jgi:hypothetical protein
MPDRNPTDGHLRSLWMGDENCGGELDLSHPLPTQFSSPMRTVGGSLTSHTPPHTQGGIRVRGMGYHAPTPQAGRVTDSDGGGRVRVGGGGCERSSATLSNGQFIQNHRGGESKIAADVTHIHCAPSPKALNFTARLLLRAEFHSALSPAAPNFFKRLLLWRLICDVATGQNLASSPCVLSFAARPLLWR